MTQQTQKINQQEETGLKNWNWGEIDMKIRKGFVSNSSSSSFIIASDVPKEELAITYTFRLEPLIEDTLETEEEITEYIIERWGYRGCETLQAILDDSRYAGTAYRKMMSAFQEGKVVYIGRVANDDVNTVSQMIYEDGFPPSPEGFEVI
jgi:hypothetical protein